MTAICIAGITGWTGAAIAAGVAAADDLELRAGVSRSAAGGEAEGAPVFASVGEALDGVDVLIDYTSHDVARDNALAAIERGRGGGDRHVGADGGGLRRDRRRGDATPASARSRRATSR